MSSLRAPSLALAVGLAFLAGCSKQAVSPPPVLPQVTVARPRQQELADFRDYTGRIEAIETLAVRARVRGFLTRIHFQEGSEVREGDLLYEIDPEPFQAEVRKAEAEVRRAEAQFQQATTEVERTRRLRGTGAVTEEELVQRSTARTTAQTAVDQAKAALETVKLDFSYTTIRAQIGGRISRTQVTVGNLVGVNEPTLLTTIVRVDPVYVYFEAPERDFLDYQEMLKSQQSLPTAGEKRVPVSVGLENQQGHPHQGVIDFRDNRVDPGTGTIQLRGTLPNPDRVLTPGLFARVRVPFGLPRPTTLVPDTALGADQRGRYVLVVTPDDTVEYRSVRTGRSYDGNTAILEGVGPDDRVIVNGMQRAKPGGKVRPQDQTTQAEGTPAAPAGSGAAPPTSGALPPATASPGGSTK